MIVLDTSAAVEIVRMTQHGQRFEETVQLDETVLSSTLLFAELASVFRKYVKAGLMPAKNATMAALTAVQLVDEFHDPSENHIEAMCEGLRLDHSPYDMFYFTLARRYGATLFTADKALARLCEREGVECYCPALEQETAVQ